MVGVLDNLELFIYFLESLQRVYYIGIFSCVLIHTQSMVFYGYVGGQMGVDEGGKKKILVRDGLKRS